MYKQKGFTIIELVVVIAIIAILSAVVLISVGVYIKKAKDLAVKADLNTFNKNAVAFFVSYNTYVGFDNGSAFNSPTIGIQKIVGNSPQYSLSSNAYCVSSILASNSTQFWCLDGAGFNGLGTCNNTTHACAATGALGSGCSGTGQTGCTGGSYCSQERFICGGYGATCTGQSNCFEGACGSDHTCGGLDTNCSGGCRSPLTCGTDNVCGGEGAFCDSGNSGGIDCVSNYCDDSTGRCSQD